jgi:hypothetical protein
MKRLSITKAKDLKAGQEIWIADEWWKIRKREEAIHDGARVVLEPNQYGVTAIEFEPDAVVEVMRL